MTDTGADQGTGYPYQRKEGLGKRCIAAHRADGDRL